MNIRILVPSIFLLLAAACSDSPDEASPANDAADNAAATNSPATTSGDNHQVTPVSCKAGEAADGCGVFVAPAGSDTDGSGTMDRPYATFARAMKDASSTLPIFACAGSYAEKVDVAPNVKIQGGLSCTAHWKPSGTRSTVLGFRALDAGQVTVSDLDVAAPDGKAPGESSIAALVQNTQIAFVRVQLEAGAGAAGAPGNGGGAAPTPGADLLAGTAGNIAGVGGALGNLGPEGTTNSMCKASVGGYGGKAYEKQGVKGTDGVVSTDANLGLGGAGDTGVGCQPGGAGGTGLTGALGQGGYGLGKLTIDGWTGANGESGGNGGPGQGGGGGGGAMGKASYWGASGGSGGAGGCGGGGGNGGGAGGSSFGLILLEGGAVHFEDVVILTATGGDGGKGGDGALGADGGKGGAGGDGSALGVKSACKGGEGGPGGFGGKGGSGAGGHSAGIAFLGSAPSLVGVKITVDKSGQSPIVLGAPAKKQGVPGMSGVTLDFAEHVGEVKEAAEAAEAKP